MNPGLFNTNPTKHKSDTLVSSSQHFCTSKTFNPAQNKIALHYIENVTITLGQTYVY